MSTRRTAAALVVVVTLGAAAAALAEGPLAIHAPPLLVPEETAGSGLAPEATVKISIDPRGNVTRVEVISIEPSTDQDELFRARLVETLSGWRFAPATRDGKPEASVLEWKVRFPAKPRQATLEIDVSGPLPGGDAEQRRSAVLVLGPDQRRQLLAAQARIATGALDAKRRHDAASPRFAVHSDADDDGKIAATVANNLEAIFNTLAQELLPGITLQPEPYKVEVFVYRERARYETLVREMPVYEFSEGFYSPAGLIALHLEQDSSDAVTGMLLHEGTHAFLDRYVVRPGVAMPRWLGEGFADYVGNSLIKGGRLIPGKTLKRKFEMQRGAVIDVTTQGGFSLDEAKRALRAGKGLGVRELLDASPEIFYGEKASLYYASSWLFVHYLRDGGDGWAAQRFPSFLLYVAEGYPQGAAFRALYGQPEAADAAFRDYVKRF